MFVNLTPHAISIVPADGDPNLPVTIQPSGHVARVLFSEPSKLFVTSDYRDYAAVQTPDPTGIDTGDAELTFGADTLYLVSRLVLDVARELDHPLAYCSAAPDTGPESAIRDAHGQIAAVRRLVVN